MQRNQSSPEAVADQRLKIAHGTTDSSPVDERLSLKRVAMCGLALFTISLVLHFAQFGRWLDNDVISGYSPGSNDPADYARRAEMWIHHGGFSRAFADGYRVPGYSAYLLPFLDLFAQPYLAARFVQILLSALLPTLMFGVGVLATRRLLPGLLAGALAIGWIPLCYFAPLLVPETQSLVLIALLCACLARLPKVGTNSDQLSLPSWQWQLSVGVLVAGLIYLKPNHVLLLPAVVGFVAYRYWRTSWLQTARSFVPACCLAVLLVAPWSVFASRSTGMFVPLSTTQGLNLYLGAGLAQSVNAELGIHDVVARHFKLCDPERDAEITAEFSELDVPASHRAYQEVAIAAWKSKPIETAAFGLAKIAHSFGGSLRGLKDSVLLAHSCLGLAALGLLWVRRDHRDWCLFLGLSVLFEMAQAFWFLPNIRFKTIFVDLQITLVMALAAETVVRDLLARSGRKPIEQDAAASTVIDHRRAA